MNNLSFGLLCLILTIFTLGVFAQEKSNSELLPACKNSNKCGFIDRTGKWVIKPKFTDSEEFSEGLAAVSVKIKGVKKYGFINETGQMIIKPQFHYAWKFSDGLARFEIEELGKDGFVDKTGKIVVEPSLDQAESFSEGLAKVSKTIVNKPNAKPPVYIVNSGFINTKGEPSKKDLAFRSPPPVSNTSFLSSEMVTLLP